MFKNQDEEEMVVLTIGMTSVLLRKSAAFDVAGALCAAPQFQEVPYCPPTPAKPVLKISFMVEEYADSDQLSISVGTGSCAAPLTSDIFPMKEEERLGEAK